jgi:hypothetical protein
MNAPKKPKKRPAPLWNTTVDLPRGRDMEAAAPLYVRYMGKSVGTDSLAQFDFRGLQPGRTFVSGPKRRNKPTRPYLYNRGDHVLVESATEADEAHLLDRDPSVNWFVPQGVWVKSFVPIGSPDKSPRWAWSCVDFLVQRTDGSVCAVEVKRRGWEFKPRTGAKLLATADACSTLGIDYELRTGLSRNEWMVFKQLHMGRRSNFLSHNEHDLVRESMIERARADSVTVGELRSLASPMVSAMLIWELLWHNRLCVDWGLPITSTAPLRLHSEACLRAGAQSAWDFRCGPHRVNHVDALRTWAASL